MINMLDKNESLLLIIDLQEKLVKALNKDIVVNRTSTLTKAARIFNIPIVATQQYSKGLGSIVEPIKQNFDLNTQIIEKSSFSAVKEPGFMEVIKSFNKKQIVIGGIETHICVYQTVSDLINEGFDVYVVKDACASRNKYEFKIGIDLMQASSAKISCVETVLFEWLKTAKSPHFKEIQALIK